MNKLLNVLSGENIKYWRDIFWQMSGNTVAQIVGVIGIPILSRIYTPTQFAEQSVFIQMITFLSGIVAFRLEYFVSLPPSRWGSFNLLLFTLKLGCIISLILTPIFFYFSGNIAALIGGGIMAQKWLWLCPICGFFITAAIAFQMYVQKQQVFKVTAVAEIFGKSFYVVGAALGVFFSRNTYFLLFASVLSALGKLLWLMRAMSTNSLVYMPSSEERLSDKVIVRKYLFPAFNLTFSHVVLSVTWFVPIAYISKHFGAEQLGQFSLVAMTLYLPSGILGVAVGQVYYQKAAEIWNQGVSFLNLLMITMKKIFLLGFLCYLVVGVASPILYPLVFGEQWRVAGSIAQIMCVSAFFSFVTSPFDKTALIVGAGWYPSFWALLRGITTLLLPFLSDYYHWDFIGFLWAFTLQLVLMYSIDGCFSWWFSMRVSKLHG